MAMVLPWLRLPKLPTICHLLPAQAAFYSGHSVQIGPHSNRSSHAPLAPYQFPITDSNRPVSFMLPIDWIYSLNLFSGKCWLGRLCIGTIFALYFFWGNRQLYQHKSPSDDQVSGLMFKFLAVLWQFLGPMSHHRYWLHLHAPSVYTREREYYSHLPMPCRIHDRYLRSGHTPFPV